MHNTRNQEEDTATHRQACLLGDQMTRYHGKRNLRLEKRLWILKDSTNQRALVFSPGQLFWTALDECPVKRDPVSHMGRVFDRHNLISLGLFLPKQGKELRVPK